MKEALLESTLRFLRLRRILPSIRLFDNPSVLDIGCGWEARLLKEIEPFIERGVGVDFKAPDIKTSKLLTFSYFFEAKDSMDIGRGDTRTKLSGKKCHLPFENESFEIVTLLSVLEHLNHPFEMLLEIQRVLRPGGIALLTVPSHLAKPILEFLAYRLGVVSEAEIRDHKRYYNKADIKALVEKTQNLKLEKHRYFQLGLNNFALLRKL